MDIRCGSCSKLFRVADEKIAGKGVRFKCSRCGETITVTKDEFELDKMARDEALAEAAPQQQEDAMPAAAPAAAPAATMPPQPDQEFQPREYQPPQTTDGGLGDFDFSEPHAAAAAGDAGGDAGADAGGDAAGEGFAFGDQGGIEGEEKSGEISISDEDAQAAEAAFQFPTDIVTEAKPLPGAKPAPADATVADVPADAPDTGAQDDVDLGAALSIPAAAPSSPPPAPAAAPRPAAPPPPPSPSPEPENDDIDLGAALAIPREKPAETPKAAPAAKTGPVFTPPPRQQPASKAVDDMDLGSALSIPRAASDEPADEEESSAMPGGAAGGGDEDIHPLTAGTLTGGLAGLAAALPVAAMLLLRFDLVGGFSPVLAALPQWYLAAVFGVAVLGLATTIGILVSALQAQTGKRLSFLINILAGTLFGAVAGAGMSAIIALAAGSGFRAEALLMQAALWGGSSFILSVLVEIARLALLRSKEESFGAEFTATGKVLLGVSALVILAALYGGGTLSGRMEHARQQLAQQAVKKPRMNSITPDGLSVMNGSGYMDPATGDLVICGLIQNAAEKPKEGWYLEAEVLDAGGKALATVRVLNGVQLFSAHDREVLAKRSVNIDQLREKMVQAAITVVPARGGIPFEVRLYGPPAGIASFLPNLKRFDPDAGPGGKNTGSVR